MLELKNKKIAPIFLFLSALLWSMSGIFTKSVTWNGVCLATLRGIIAVIVSGFLLKWHMPKLNRAKILAAICYFVQGVLFMCANKYTTAANATVLQNTSPLYIILLNIFLAHKKPTRVEIVTCVCLFGGVALAFAGNLGGGGMVGNILALVSALFYAGVFFLSKEDGAEPLESLFLGNAYYLVLVPFLIANETVQTTSISQWGFLLIFAALTGIGAWLCFAVGIKGTSALQANFITIAEPVMAPIWTFLFLKETISPLSFAGCAVVIITILAYNIYMTKKSENTVA